MLNEINLQIVEYNVADNKLITQKYYSCIFLLIPVLYYLPSAEKNLRKKSKLRYCTTYLHF